ncbi:hypothetical protein GCM10010885_19690 [Alicyclobacillus cellulosilyticus]|uniref:Uncharacterized protein n=1 Tax=Alicyclobacillus cellulosilyticus TaxID=1003997 RepID=A0A917KGJ8_9BACL|nr:hypothetical protein [Alicyclobacillus cellulosilyticus]GGJ10539.1 hypothetical protein GCM10010885_19690 [Alicyclobacillus cellulosilyticus]
MKAWFPYLPLMTLMAVECAAAGVYFLLSYRRVDEATYRTWLPNVLVGGVLLWAVGLAVGRWLVPTAADPDNLPSRQANAVTGSARWMGGEARRVSAATHAKTPGGWRWIGAPAGAAETWPHVAVARGASLPVGKEGIACVAWSGGVIAVGGYTGGYFTQSVFMLPFPAAGSGGTAGRAPGAAARRGGVAGAAERGETGVLQIAALPQPTHDAAAGIAGGDVYVLGGGQAAPVADVYRIHAGRVSRLPALPRPLSDASAVPWTQDGQAGFLVLGGYDGRVFNTTARWYFVTPHGRLASHAMFQMPVGLRYTALAAGGQEVLWAGGLTPSGAPSTAVFAWRSGTRPRIIARLPVALAKAAAFTWHDFLIVAGGVAADGNPSRVIWAVRLSDGSTRRVGELPVPLADMGYAQWGVLGVLVGGWTGHSMNPYLYRVEVTGRAGAEGGTA